MASDWILSVDFGTSNTAAAHSAAVSGAIESLPLSHTSNLMSSGVFVDAPDRIAVGDHATNEAQRNPAAFIPSPKRLIGQQTIAVNGHSLPIWAPVASVFSAVFSRAAAVHANTRPSHLVLTHPEAWSPDQVRVLIDAAVAAGMPAESVSTVSEPRAAAAHYARSKSLADGAKVAVFDFGGGTLDVAVLRKVSDGRFDVLAARGDNGLGGKNFDASIRQWVDHQLDARNPDLKQYLRREAPVGVRHQLDDSIRRAKELLSEAPSATITVAGGGFHETLQITRDEFDELITPALTAARQLTQATFADAGIAGPSDLAALYLTGGTSRIPLVHRILAPIGPIATLDDPKTVVAQGALSSYLAGRPAPDGWSEVPNVSDVMAQWGEGPGTGPRPAASTDPGPVASDARASDGPSRPRRRGVLLGAVAAVVVVVVVVVAAIVLTGRDSTGPQNDAATSGAPSSSAKVTLASDQGQILAALPSQLRSDLENCQANTVSTSREGSSVNCVVSPTSSLLTGVADTDNTRVIVTLDQRQAQSWLVAIKDGTPGYGDGDLVSSGNADSAARVVSSGSQGWTINFADKDSYITLTGYGFNDAAGARTWLTRAGLLSS